MSFVSWVEELVDRHDDRIVATIIIAACALLTWCICLGIYAIWCFFASIINPTPPLKLSIPVAVETQVPLVSSEQVAVESWTRGQDADFTVLIDRRAGTRILYIQSHHYGVPVAVALLPIQSQPILPESIP